MHWKMAEKAKLALTVAPFATPGVLFALARCEHVQHMERAFQASSPKTSKPGRQRPGFFCPLAAGAARRRVFLLHAGNTASPRAFWFAGQRAGFAIRAAVPSCGTPER